MADRLKDEDDKRLEALFQSVPIADDGFTARVVAGARRRVLVQRFSLPVAIGLGLLFALKPLLHLFEILPRLFGLLPSDVVSSLEMPVGNIPQMSTIVLGVALLGAIMVAGRIIEES